MFSIKDIRTSHKFSTNGKTPSLLTYVLVLHLNLCACFAFVKVTISSFYGWLLCIAQFQDLINGPGMPFFFNFFLVVHGNSGKIFHLIMIILQEYISVDAYLMLLLLVFLQSTYRVRIGIFKMIEKSFWFASRPRRTGDRIKSHFPQKVTLKWGM